MKRRGVLPAMNFMGNNGVRYFDREWLRKASNILREGILTKNAGNDRGTPGNEKEIT